MRLGSLLVASIAVIACARTVPIAVAAKGAPVVDAQTPHRVSILGRTYTLRRIELEGNAHLASSTLRAALSLATADAIDEQLLDRDRLILSALYYDQGYLDVKVGAPRFADSETSDDLVITIPIDEGAQYSIASFVVYEDVDGKRAPPMNGWSKPAFAGEVFHRDRLVKSLAALRRVYRDAGYAFVEADPETQLDAAHHTISLTVPIRRGVLAHFGAVRFAGNRAIDDAMLRALVGIVEGQRYSETALEASRARLEALEIFQRVDVSTQVGGAPDAVDVTFEVEFAEAKGPVVAGR